ncbi:hypothetical protein AAF712_010945 [Marasmius tenuissimus]|uniref:F-box protein n=1 Tax=Marasmius tenuissimus TaxID=585030 RepID=A0ABR2ZLF5_9AGAR
MDLSLFANDLKTQDQHIKYEDVTTLARPSWMSSLDEHLRTNGVLSLNPSMRFEIQDFVNSAAKRLTTYRDVTTLDGAKELDESPLLTYLRLIYVGEGAQTQDNGHISQVGIPFPQLRHLVVEHGEFWSVAATIEGLQQCTQLESLIYTDSAQFYDAEYQTLPHSFDDSNMPCIELPISFFQICFGCKALSVFAILDDLLSKISLRQATEVKIECRSPISPRDVDYLVEKDTAWPGNLLLSRLDREKLTKLTLTNLPLHSRVVLSLLRQLVALEALTIQDLTIGLCCISDSLSPCIVWKEWPDDMDEWPLYDIPRYADLCACGKPESHNKSSIITGEFLKEFVIIHSGDVYGWQRWGFLPRLKELRLLVQHFVAGKEFLAAVQSRFPIGKEMPRGVQRLSTAVLRIGSPIESDLVAELLDLERRGLKMIYSDTSRSY